MGKNKNLRITEAINFKEALKERGIKIVLRCDKKMMKDADRIMKKIKSSEGI